MARDTSNEKKKKKKGLKDIEFALEMWKISKMSKKT